MNATDLSTWRVAPTLDWLEAWATWLRMDETKRGGGVLAEKSLAAYLQSASHFKRSGHGLEFQELLTEANLRSYFAAQEEAKVPPKTFNHRLTTVRKIVKWAVLEGLITTDPTRRIERAQEMCLPRRAKNADEISALETAAIVGARLKRSTERWGWLGERDYMIWMLFKNTTLRIEEMCKLDVDDIDLVDGTMRIIGKGNIHETAPINDELRSALEHWLSIKPGGKALICDWQGSRITTGQVRRRLEAIGVAAGVKIKPHDMRHTRVHRIVREALNNGMSFEVALSIGQTLARHKDPRTTLGYLRASFDELVAVNNAA